MSTTRLLVFLLATAFTSSIAAKPNILVILADDLGWGELSCQGVTTQIPTPNIDSIAKNGVRFTNGYVSGPYCSPTRAGFMTARYQQRFGHEFNPGPAEAAVENFGLSLNETTIADRFKAVGYATGWFGKSHLGYKPEFHPQKRGFDDYFGFLGGAHDYLDATGDAHNPILRGTEPVAEMTYITEVFAQEAVNFIQKNREKPWFCYLPFNAVHAPLEATAKYLERFSGVTDDKRKHFCAMLSAMDDGVGNVLAKLRELKLEEDTLIVFFSDNGGPTPSTTSGNGPLRGFKMTTFEGGPRIPFLAQWKGKFPAGKVYDHPVMNLDVLPTIIAAAGAKTDPSWQLDGVDLTPYVTGANNARPHQTLYWRYGPQWAVRHGDMKLVVSKGGSGQPELYNLAEDIGESKDLAAAQPAKTKELQALWDKWSAEQAAPSAPDAPAAGKAKKGGKKKAGK